ncbi:hypothetical protein MRB53_040527 [Persea americana]|nr:hypothetical protein MRB53_040527 [Persea americana]
MSELAYAGTKTLTHQGQQFRLSLPRNDRRQSQDLSYKSATPVSPISQQQTVDEYPFESQDDAMRVICSIADRAQWEQHLRLMRENRLRALGVGCTHQTFPVANKTAPEYTRINWTGLHTPATSTDSLSPTTPANENIAMSESIALHLMALKVRKEELSKQVAELAADNTHSRSLSQRDLVHRRLNSIQPVVIRKPSRIVSAISSIPEDVEVNFDADAHLTAEEGADILIALGSTASAAADKHALHQHLRVARHVGTHQDNT